MGLFKPAWQSKNESKALKAVEKETNEEKLIQIAKNASSYEVRKNAILKINDQNVLADIAKGDSLSDWQSAAYKLIDYPIAQSVYLDIALNDNDAFKRKIIVEKYINDESVLMSIAKNDNHYIVREAAVSKLTDEAILVDIAQNDEDGNVRYSAVTKLYDQSLLVDIFNNDDDPNVCVAALSKIEDYKFVRSHAFCDQEKSPKVRSAALGKCSMEKDLVKSIMGIDPAYSVRKKAAEILQLNISSKSNSFYVAQDIIDKAERNAEKTERNAISNAFWKGEISKEDLLKSYSSTYHNPFILRDPPSKQMRIIAARKIAGEAIDYIARIVNLGMEPDVELLSHENAIITEIGIDNDFANIKELIVSYLKNIGFGNIPGSSFPTQAYRLVYLLNDWQQLNDLVTLNSRIYEYQKIKEAAEIMLSDRGKKGFRHKKNVDKKTDHFNNIIAPFIQSDASLFYNSESEQTKKEALRKILSEGIEGEKFLLEFLLRDVTIVDGYFLLKFYGDSAHNEWVNKNIILKALSSTSEKSIIEKFTEILLCKGKEPQFYSIIQPTIAEILGKMKEYNALGKLILSDQNSPAVLLAKDILRLYEAGVIDKSENLRDEYGCTPLHNAVITKDSELVKKLINSGADLDTVLSIGENIGQTALFLAVVGGNLDIVKMLIEHGANVNASDNTGFPLQRAAAMGFYDIAKLLVDNGANKQQKTLTGKTALMWAEKNNHTNIVALLK